jgi:hypothetical protein
MVMRPVLLLQPTPTHLQQSLFSPSSLPQEERRPEGYSSSCLKLRSACLSLSMHLNSALSAAEMNLGPGFTYKSSTILGYKEAEHWTIYALSAWLQRRWNGYGSNKSNENFQFTLISANSFPSRVKVHCNGNS